MSLFLSEHMYIEEPDDGFIAGLIELRSKLQKQQLKTRPTSKCLINVTLDVDTIAFVKMLKQRYNMVFSTRNEVVETMILNMKEILEQPGGAKYLGNRFLDILELHPIAKGR